LVGFEEDAEGEEDEIVITWRQGMHDSRSREYFRRQAKELENWYESRSYINSSPEAEEGSECNL
jgi:hypothetical protein